MIVELVGGQGCLQRVTLLRSRGKVLIVGVQAGATVPLRMFDLMLVRGHLIGTTVRGRPHAEKALLAGLVRTSILPLLAHGRLRVPVDTTFSIDRYADGYARFAGPGKFGKVHSGLRMTARCRVRHQWPQKTRDIES
ncbi:hypothetical protein [Streptomyces rimosus]|uniref:hypothetical protein n=1 Tax=Streptomyces rimosus TaxID=1927 RepID=UPI003795614F